MSGEDRIERFGSSMIQHGPSGRRVYLMRAAEEDLPELAVRLIEFARVRGYGKVFARIPETAVGGFRAAGYEVEGKVPGYYCGREGALFLGYYLDPERRSGDRGPERVALERVRKQAARPVSVMIVAPAPRLLEDGELEEAARLYRLIFPTYPFPIGDPGYLRRTRGSHIDYYGIRERGRLVALASAEKDPGARAAELTDFATHPEARGRSLATALLDRMEDRLTAAGYLTAYTIARTLSPGMNITFARAGYRFGGLLWKNTPICGGIESMNIWYKSLSPRRPPRPGMKRSPAPVNDH